MKKEHTRSITVLFILILSPIILLNFNLERKATFSLIFLISLFLLFNKELLKDLKFSEYKYQSFKLKNLVYFLIIFSTLAITQNQYLHIETIDWDIASYLVASQEIGKGFLPNETQWESKGPLFFYMYYFITLFTGKNFVLFKLVNDFLLFFLAVIIFLIVYIKSKNNGMKSFFASLFFVLSMSQAWAISGYSEIYSLLFISSAYLLLIKFNSSNLNYLSIGLLLSFSTLVNQGTILIAIPFLIYVFRESVKDSNYKLTLSMLLGMGFPHLIFLIIYFLNDLLTVYLATYVQIPLGYTEASFASFYELKIFIKEFFEFSPILYFSIISIIYFISKGVLINIRKKNLEQTFDFLNQLLVSSLLFYFIGSHNYYHHLIFLLFFISISIYKINFTLESILINSFILISTIVIFTSSFNISVQNLTNLDKIQNEYPLYQLSEEIDSYFVNDYEILALDYVLVLFYLDKPNKSYIIHPSNHFEEFIVTTLDSLNIIDKDYVGNIILDYEPEVIMCSQKMIIRGIPTKNTLYNCAVTDYKSNYLQIDTLPYKKSTNLNFYFDPYKEINVYVKK